MDLINYWTVDVHMLALQLHLSPLCTVHALSLKGKVKWQENLERGLADLDGVMRDWIA